MNHSKIFMLVFLLFFGLYEAKNPNRIIVHNQLGSGIPLQYHCHDNGDKDTGVRTLSEFNSNWTHTFFDSIGVIVWNCDLHFQTDKEYYFDNLEVYRNGIIIRSGQLRQWTARLDGIYFTRDYKKPVEHVLNWNSTNI
ncbi:hypothetical protein EUTSA_v10023047mg [Eutrema salsugineum]|uniref:Uncharacterized protein n=1 Tax=Eutrema salsugineum TaxID=72664 RepID=V4NVB1_EUTSA|nr:hypothetical protein EUTSA_v10023047mg [Eutrema salsugineum]